MSTLHETYLGTQAMSAEQLASSAGLRCALTTLLQRTNHALITPAKATPNPESFLNGLKTRPKIHQASMSRQFAADLPPDIEQTALKDGPKDWFIKTVDFGDDYDRVLQHRDGEYAQLLEDVAYCDRIFQEGCGRIILLRPSNCSGYDVLLAAAMQCLGCTKEQFQFIVVQPIELHAFRKPAGQVRPIPGLAPQELVKAVGMDALRWRGWRVPLTGVAPIDISTAGQAILNPVYESQ